MKLNATTRRTLKGFLLVILPIVAVVWGFMKVKTIVQAQVLPIESQLPGEKVLGFGLISLISVVLIVLISFITGVLIESNRMSSYFTFLEKNFLVFVPGYFMIKSKFTDAVVSDNDQRKVVLVNENDGWKFGIEVDRHPNNYCTIFFPFPPDAKSGEIKVVHESKLKTSNINITRLTSILRHYGHGAAGLVK